MEESASFQRGSPGGKKVPMSPAETAPSSASVMACNSTSPSEWPANPSGWSMYRPPILSGTPGLNACESQPYPILMFMVFLSASAYRDDRFSKSTTRESAMRRLALQIELGQLQVARLRDLEIRSGTRHDGHLR